MSQPAHKQKLVSPELVVSDNLADELQPKAEKGSLSQMSADEFLSLLENASPDELMKLADEGVAADRLRTQKRSILKEFVHVPEGERTLAASLIWWEGRRVIFNSVVGAAGLPIAALLIMVGMPIYYVIFGVIAYAIAANLCYTLGYGAEVVASKIFGPERAKRLAPELLVLGFIFAILATVLGGLAFLALSTGVV